MQPITSSELYSASSPKDFIRGRLVARRMPMLAAALVTTSIAAASSAQNAVIQAVERVRSDCNIPGVAVSVFLDSQILATVFQGVRHVGEPDQIQDNDLFNLASCTKSMTATLAAIAVERGALEWDSTISATLPNLAMNAAYQDVTLQQLLTHHAGVAALTDDETSLFRAAVIEAPEDPRAARRHLAEVVLAAAPTSPPGTEFAYSNAGYAIAGHMIETALGDDFESLLQHEIFTPAEMTTAIVGWPATPERPAQPRGHRVVDGERRPEMLGEDKDFPALAPAGDVSCSIEDFARFGMAHLKGLAGQEGLVTPQSMQALHTAQGESEMAMGWFIRDLHGEEIHFHDGGTGRFSAAIMLLPRHNLGVVVLTNVGGGAGAGGEACQRLCVDLLRMAMQLQKGGR